MKLYSYVIPRDYGFAPNPYFNYCTLATCKPVIRRVAHIGDWLAAYGAAASAQHGKLVYIMQISEIMSFDEYWEDVRFKSKHPIYSKGVIHMYGDNIYHHLDGEWIQEYSHHSKEDGSINYINLNRDTKTDRVLIATEFYYFGSNAVDIPEDFADMKWKYRQHGVPDDEKKINEFIAYIRENYTVGRHGIPYSRKEGAFVHYKGE